MTKQIHVSKSAHGQLAKLKGILFEKNVADVVDRLMIQAGYNSAFWARHADLIKERENSE